VASVSLFELFRVRAPRDPAAVFLEPPAGPPLTYVALDGATARLQTLLGRLGVRRGDRVAIQVEKSPAAVLLYLACLRRGAIAVPLNPAYTAVEMAHFLADAEPRLLVCDPGRVDELAAAGIAQVRTLDADGRGSLDEYRDLEPDPTIAPCGPDDVALILYTSGTTGRPKGAMLTHGNLAANARMLHRVWRFVPGDVLLHALPIFHAHGLFVALHCALVNGSRVLFLPRFDAAEVVRLLPRASVFMGVPTHYTRLLAEPALDRDVTIGMRLFLSGSAPLAARTHGEFAERTGHEILERYGMTETGMITSNPYDGARVPGTVGYALPGVAVRVADEAGRELPRGTTGVVEVRGPNVFPGYWRMPERTVEDFQVDGFFITGDLGVMAADGRLTLVGRARDLMISGGYNVYSAEVEAALDAVPGVRESAAFGVAHPDFGEGVTAVVVPDGTRPLVEDDVRAALAGTLASYKRPKRVFVADTLPRNAMGKVQKDVLRERYAATYVTGGTAGEG
jgi:malonyl-CoA/methylmalonyl-CoA synthetase